MGQIRDVRFAILQQSKQHEFILKDLCKLVQSDSKNGRCLEFG